MACFPYMILLPPGQNKSKGVCILAKKKPQWKPDRLHEGREDYYIDVDRMMNEGMAGGTVNWEHDHPSVDFYHDVLQLETKPRET